MDRPEASEVLINRGHGSRGIFINFPSVLSLSPPPLSLPSMSAVPVNPVESAPTLFGDQ